MSNHVDRVRQFVRVHEKTMGGMSNGDFIAGVFDRDVKDTVALRRGDLEALLRDAERLAELEDV